MGTNKQLPSKPESILLRDSELLESITDGQQSYSFAEDFICSWMREYANEVVKYTLKQAAEKGLVRCYSTEGKDESSKDFFYFVDADETVKVDKQSILSLEEQIIKDLGL